MRALVAGVAVVLAALAARGAEAAVWPSVPSSAQLARERAADLAAAEAGVADAQRWWNADESWYNDFLFPQGAATLARLWSVYPLLESLVAVYRAEPSADNLARLQALADPGAGVYWNPSLQPVGGYEWYPGLKTAASAAYYDDSGWWGIAYIDAYAATDDPRYLVAAHRAFVFIVGSGWDPVRGGTWWETGHNHKTIEPLAAALLIGTRLYEIRHKSWYLGWVKKLLAWADANSFNHERGLYQRSASDDTVLSYAEALIIVAQQELCQALKQPLRCAKARQLADAASVAFPPEYWWAPQYDAVYLRWMLEYYTLSGDSRWYALALDRARLVRDYARDPYNGLFTHGWDGRWIADGLEEHAGNTAVLAWAAAAPTPAARRR